MATPGGATAAASHRGRRRTPMEVVLERVAELNARGPAVAVGKISTTSVRRRISRLRRSLGLLDQTWRQISLRKLIMGVRERRIEVPYPRSGCINAVLADTTSWSQRSGRSQLSCETAPAMRTIPASRSSASTRTPEPCPKRSATERARACRRVAPIDRLVRARPASLVGGRRYDDHKRSTPARRCSGPPREGHVQRHEPDIEPQRGQDSEE